NVPLAQRPPGDVELQFRFGHVGPIDALGATVDCTRRLFCDLEFAGRASRQALQGEQQRGSGIAPHLMLASEVGQESAFVTSRSGGSVRGGPADPAVLLWRVPDPGFPPPLARFPPPPWPQGKPADHPQGCPRRCGPEYRHELPPPHLWPPAQVRSAYRGPARN